MTNPLSDALDLLHQAAGTKYGIVVTTDNVDLLKSRLYKARKQFGDQFPVIVSLTIRTSPEDYQTQVWIVKPMKETSNAAQGQALEEGHSGHLQIPNHPPNSAGRGPGHAISTAEIHEEQSGGDDPEELPQTTHK